MRRKKRKPYPDYWEWRESRTAKRQDEFHYGEKIVATLRWESVFSTLAHAQTSAGAWTFDRPRILSRDVEVREAAAGEADIRRFEDGVRLEVQQAWQDLATARVRHITAKNSLAAASEAVRVRESRFKQGLDKMIDLLDAETALREAELRELVARYDVALDTYHLGFVSGANLISDLR